MNSMDFGERKGTDTSIYGNDEDPEHSRWIHRDKLAQIESQELQAAGILLPRARGRAQSKSSRRERSRDQQSSGVRSEQSGQHQKRQRIGSLPSAEIEGVENQENAGWDLRTPEEAAYDTYDGHREFSSGQKGMSRIPLSKTSPLPIPLDYLERPTPIQRSRSNGWSGEEEAISYPKSRTRSESTPALEDIGTPTPVRRAAPDTSPKKTGPTPRKGSVSKARAASGQTRPKTRSGSKDTPTSRPPTRSGELGNTSVKRPEGDPPWLATMYKPDPRLPPDQQLLPTVAKRLQQEQWEKEGKFGNAYDREFRPLNDEEFAPQPELLPSPRIEEPEQKPEEQAEWPLGPLKPTLSPSPSTGTGTGGRPNTSGGYSTMPKVRDTPGSVMGTPRILPVETQIMAVQEPEAKKKRGGCGCCVVM